MQILIIAKSMSDVYTLRRIIARINPNAASVARLSLNAGFKHLTSSLVQANSHDGPLWAFIDTDLNGESMRVKTPLQKLELFANRSSKVRFVAMANKIPGTLREQIIRMGVHDTLSKPYQPKEVARILSTSSHATAA